MAKSDSATALQVKGVALLAVMAVLVGVSIAAYQKRFTQSVDVTVIADRAGLQMNQNGDVRMRGVLIGRISSINFDGKNVLLRLAIKPSAAREIPANVTARFLPTTLFGQKYVELVVPQSPAQHHIEAGATIDPDRSAATVELGTALDNLGSLLTAVRPQDLSQMLTTLATGLQGRGDDLGKTIVNADHLLSRLNTQLPLLVRDLVLTGDVSAAYAAAAPHLFAALSNLSTTSDTITERREALARFLTEFRSLATEATQFLDQNGDGLVEVTRTTAPVLRLLARYSPALPCLLHGLAIGEDSLNTTFRHDIFQLTVRLGLAYPGYTSSDRPTTSVDTGANCAGLPSVGGVLQVPHFDDGADWAPGALVQVPGGAR
ncbi:MAG: MCE family protein [Marmoricola sp.]